MTKRGRPLGVKAFAVLNVVRTQPMTLAALSQQLQLSYGDAQRTVHRLAATGRVTYGEFQYNTGGRPARLLQVSTGDAPSMGMDALATLWRIR